MQKGNYCNVVLEMGHISGKIIVRVSSGFSQEKHLKDKYATR